MIIKHFLKKLEIKLMQQVLIHKCGLKTSVWAKCDFSVYFANKYVKTTKTRIMFGSWKENKVTGFVVF